MINRFLSRFKQKPATTPVAMPSRRGVFTTDDFYLPDSKAEQAIETVAEIVKSGFSPYAKQHEGKAMDSLGVGSYNGRDNRIPEPQLIWYSNQSFIGYQMAAILSQNWLIKKCCYMPARDAVRMGYEITVNDGTDVDPKVLDEIRKADRRMKINENMIEFVDQGRVFGIRVAMFMVASEDPEYYKKPFNPDGVKPGSYKGISQIDPYWITPQLDAEAAGVPSAINFYVPTWWTISGKLVHRSHLVIFKTEEVPDILKPSYIYGGVPIPQKIMERVYAAERTANEAPLLALTKRTDVINIDLAQAIANQQSFDARLRQWVFNRDNYGIKALGLEEKMEQFDTSLADLDDVIMTQFQLVSAAANVPTVKLMGTTPKGFNATGEYEEASYHEELESIQKHDLTPLLDRHHLLLIRSEIAPKFSIAPFETEISWNSLDAMTAEELATVNKTKAETDNILVQAGAIDGMDSRERIINDPKSGYNGIDGDAPEPVEESDPEGA